MDGDPIPSIAAVAFDRAADAQYRVAGVAAAARIVRELAEAGFEETWLALPAGEMIDERTMRDIRRLAGSMAVRIGEPPDGEPVCRIPGNRLVPADAILTGRVDEGLALDRPGAAADILQRTGKPSDGPISRWLNRPLSRRLSALLLHVPGLRPIHASAGTALLAAAMFGALVAGGDWGLIAGGLLFQAASIFDGVDGEVARATFRSSRAGAALDTTIDVATSVLLVAGLTVNLALRGQGEAVVLSLWGLSLFVLGLVLISWHARRTGGSFSFNRIKRHYRRRTSGTIAARLIAFATLVTSRDFFALLFAVLIVSGLAIVALYLFAVGASVWILFVAGSTWPLPKSSLSPDNG